MQIWQQVSFTKSNKTQGFRVELQRLIEVQRSLGVVGGFVSDYCICPQISFIFVYVCLCCF